MGEDWIPSRIVQALEGNQELATKLEKELTPVIQTRVARKLLARNPTSSLDLQDFVQQVWEVLLEDGQKVLRRWAPERGLSLRNYVGLVAERLTVTLLRTGSWNGWREDPTLSEDRDPPSQEPDPEEAAAGREELDHLLDALQARLSPLGWSLFEILFVEDLDVQEAARRLGMTRWAVYQWRSRLSRLARELRREICQDRASDTNTGLG